MILCYYPKNSDIKPLNISFSYLDYLEISNDITLHLSNILTKVSDLFYVFHRQTL